MPDSRTEWTENQSWLLTEPSLSIIICGHRGVAKFGIALGSGPRDLGFESRHFDQINASAVWQARLFLYFCIICTCQYTKHSQLLCTNTNVSKIWTFKDIFVDICLYRWYNPFKLNRLDRGAVLKSMFQQGRTTAETERVHRRSNER